jgi:hypothetical protein
MGLPSKHESTYETGVAPFKGLATALQKVDRLRLELELKPKAKLQSPRRLSAGCPSKERRA